MPITRDALLAAVCEQPDNDHPRLIYADWLEEHGDDADRDRAAFIRLQIEAKNPATDLDRLCELRRREKALLEQYAATWQKPFAAAHKPFFERGFVANVTLSLDALLRRGKRFFEAAPLQYLHLTSVEGEN